MTDYELARRIMKRVRNWSVEDVRDVLDYAGIEVLGYGAYGVVIDCGDCVAKFFSADDYAYRAFLDIVHEHPSDYLPEVYFSQPVNKVVYEAVMEKLEPLENENNIFAATPVDFINFRKAYSNARSKNPEVNELVRLLAAHKSGISSLGFWVCDDLHTGNAMRRGKQLVITDPWCD